MVAVPFIAMLVFLLAVGVPVGFAMGMVGTAGLMWVGGLDAVLSILSTTPYRSVANFTLATVPLFIFMAEVVTRTNMSREIFDAAGKWLGRTRGGLAMATVLASAGMGAISGSSVAAAAALSSTTVPEMQRAGYSARVSAGVVTVAGTLAVLIPPSIPLVLYGIITETSIGQLLIAGIIPGLMSAAVYFCGIYIWGKIAPAAMPKAESYSWRTKLITLKPLWPFLVLGILVIGTLYAGIGTATESAAIGAFGAALIGLITRRIGMRGLYAAGLHTAKLSSMIFTIIIGAMILGYFFSLTRTPQRLIEVIADAGLPSWGVMGLIVIMYLAMGAAMDQVAILLLTLPLTFPIAMELGYSPIWFGIVVTVLSEIGLVTPPVGLNAYVVSAASKVPLGEVFRGTTVMLVFALVTLAIVIAFPSISTWLPSLMK
ncbi:MAG: TRAP transporter large permease [Thermoleophilia bacterium]